MSKKEPMEIVEDSLIFSDYPVNKYAKKIDWWTSDKGLELIAGWRTAGCTIKEIVEKMGIDARTFRSWRKKCPRLDEAMVIGKEIATTRVVNSLYKRALGYDYQESVQELVEGEMITTKIYTKHMPPDVKAILSYLYNRDCQNWRSLQQPIDMNLPAIQNAENILVTIRETAENALPTHGKPQEDTGDDQGGQTPV
jgi:hypothetical protein